METSDLEKIRDILLQHSGKSNVISAKKISKSLGFPMEDTQSLCRDKIHETAERFELSVCSCSKGYFITSSDEELKEYEDNIQKRINGMKKNLNIAKQNFKGA
ncbi:hypothetical protein [Pseudoleptotrichia goodfellowii]|uniref:Uncharacterized protein n=1 Tax=Pseudoleptotrichia goodfellowii TaxID=157692 RepID=A0A510JBN8_9FUSO|nr:hypothetical protein [Pseudoleptotrichia goodfellowii]BBM36702.1 hypothetical protein JCM16774_1646 [Pseudoleptotrichia goodfellowii]